MKTIDEEENEEFAKSSISFWGPFLRQESYFEIIFELDGICDAELKWEFRKKICYGFFILKNLLNLDGV